MQEAKSNKAEVEQPAGKKIAHDDDYSGAHRVPHNSCFGEFSRFQDFGANFHFVILLLYFASLFCAWFINKFDVIIEF
jgi:hypothetical protein